MSQRPSEEELRTQLLEANRLWLYYSGSPHSHNKSKVSVVQAAREKKEMDRLYGEWLQLRNENRGQSKGEAQ